jgi:hypothetical protein
MALHIERLVLPAALVVTTIVVGAGSCKSSTSNGDDEGSHVTYCVDIESMAACNDAAACAWNDAAGECENTCHEITVEAECVALDRCEWSIAEGSGGGETCHEVFT